MGPGRDRRARKLCGGCSAPGTFTVTIIVTKSVEMAALSLDWIPRKNPLFDIESVANYLPASPGNCHLAVTDVLKTRARANSSAVGIPKSITSHWRRSRRFVLLD